MDSRRLFTPALNDVLRLVRDGGPRAGTRLQPAQYMRLSRALGDADNALRLRPRMLKEIEDLKTKVGKGGDDEELMYANAQLHKLIAAQDADIVAKAEQIESLEAILEAVNNAAPNSRSEGPHDRDGDLGDQPGPTPPVAGRRKAVAYKPSGGNKAKGRRTKADA